MRSIRDILGASLPAKVGVTAAAIVVLGGGAALAAPGLGTVTEMTSASGSESELLEENPESFLEQVEEFCEASTEAPFCSGPSDRPGENGENKGKKPVEDSVDDELADAEVADLEDAEGEGAEAFSAWVRSLPNDWGCVRGQLVSHVARTGPHDANFGEWEFDSAEAAAKELGLEGRCVDVAVARAGGDPDADSDLDEMEAASVDGADSGPPAHAQKPDHAGRSGHAGKPEQVGKPSHAGQSGAKGSNGRGRGR